MMWFHLRKRDLLWMMVKSLFNWSERKDMNTDKFSFKKTFQHTGSSFSANSAAEQWLRGHGFSIGSMCCDEPRGLKKGSMWIHKWRNLSIEDKDILDGVMTSEDFRNGDITIHLYKDPDV